MNVEIYTSEPEAVDPAQVARLLTAGGFLVLEVTVNDGERTFAMCQDDAT